MANHIAGVAKLLGVEVGEIFRVDKDPALKGYLFKFSDNNLLISLEEGGECHWGVANGGRLVDLLYGRTNINKLPWKPANGQPYYVPGINPAMYNRYTWSHDENEFDSLFFEHGLIFRTKEAAIKMTKKLLAVAQEVRNNG